MPLPKIEVPKYELTVPSSGAVLKYRPFLVREEKILLIAMESEDEGQMVFAIKDIIQSCTYEELDINNMPMFDIEYIFLQLRAKSKGEVVDLIFQCDKCKSDIPVNVNLNDVKIIKTEGHDKNIPLSDTVGITMRYPSIEIQSIVDPDKSDVENIFKTIEYCIESIWDKETVYSTKDHTKEEMDNFLESLPDDSFNKIQNFFNTLPVLKHDIIIKCKSKNGKGKKASVCGFSKTQTLEGLASFFG